MKLNRKIAILLLVLCLISIVGPLPSYGEALEETTGFEKDIYFLLHTIEYVKNNYPFEVNEEDLINNAVKGILQGLDPYSNYYTKEEAKKLLTTITGSYVGIGVYIGQKDGYIEVISVIKNSPAEKVGLKAGDLIVSIDGMDIKDIGVEEASSLIKGPEGSTVNIGILREGKSKPIYFTVTRSKIIFNPIEYEILEDNIAYIKVHEFSQYTTKNLREALERLDKKEIKKLIIDLRNNPGGLLNEAISMSRLFVPDGPILHIRQKNKPLRTYYSTLKNPKYDLVVLVNEKTASASEIFAGAVKDRRAGVLVGTKTYGKGIIQSMYPFGDGSFIKMTTAEYLTPNKTSIHNTGIEPDIIVENKNGEDLQLKKAIKLLKSN